MPYSWVFWHNGEPIFAYGVLTNPTVPHLGQVWGCGTSAAWKAIPTVAEHFKTQTLPDLFKPGSPVNRVEVRVLAANKTSTAWIAKHLAGRFETVLKDFGTKQETFLQYAWLRSDFNVL